MNGSGCRSVGSRSFGGVAVVTTSITVSCPLLPLLLQLFFLPFLRQNPKCLSAALAQYTMDDGGAIPRG